MYVWLTELNKIHWEKNKVNNKMHFKCWEIRLVVMLPKNCFNYSKLQFQYKVPIKQHFVEKMTQQD